MQNAGNSRSSLPSFIPPAQFLHSSTRRCEILAYKTDRMLNQFVMSSKTLVGQKLGLMKSLQIYF